MRITISFSFFSGLKMLRNNIRSLDHKVISPSHKEYCSYFLINNYLIYIFTMKIDSMDLGVVVNTDQ